MNRRLICQCKHKSTCFEKTMKQPKCIIKSGGTKEWYLNGERHREDGPAYEHPSGIKQWYLNGKEIFNSPINTHGLKVGDLVFMESEPAIVVKKTETFIYFFLDEQEVVYVNG